MLPNPFHPRSFLFEIPSQEMDNLQSGSILSDGWKWRTVLTQSFKGKSSMTLIIEILVSYWGCLILILFNMLLDMVSNDRLSGWVTWQEWIQLHSKVDSAVVLITLQVTNPLPLIEFIIIPPSIQLVEWIQLTNTTWHQHLRIRLVSRENAFEKCNFFKNYACTQWTY